MGTRFIFTLNFATFFFQGEGIATCDAVERGILDSYLVKYWGLKFACNAACTVLRVDQVSRIISFNIFFSFQNAKLLFWVKYLVQKRASSFP